MLEAIVADRNRPQKHVERARVVLAAAERGPVQPMATRLGISRPMVWRWQQRFAEGSVPANGGSCGLGGPFVLVGMWLKQLAEP
jgi:Homeodomain-like domain